MLLPALLLTLAWLFLTGDFSFANLAFAFVLSWGILLLGRGEKAGRRLRRPGKALYLFVFFIWELFKANWAVARGVLTPGQIMRPGIVAIPLDVQSDAEITLLANLITLTPGTLSLGVSDDRKVLYIHAVFIDTVEGTRQEIKQGFERLVREVFS